MTAVRDRHGRFVTTRPRPAGMREPIGGLSRVEAQLRARAVDTYGDREFAGLGVIRCTLCGRPCRDHRIGPCPEWVGRR
jgi:hypothetical protein